MSATFVGIAPALAHGGEIEAVVEVASVGSDYQYGIRLTWADGDPIAEAEVSIVADQGPAVEALEQDPGVYVGTVQLQGEGERQIEVTVRHPDADGIISFVHEMAADAGLWVVVVDTVNEDRVGLEPDPSQAILQPPPPSVTTTTVVRSPPEDESSIAAQTTTTLPRVESTQPATGGNSHTSVDFDSTGNTAFVDIGMRLAHLGAIGMWIVPVFAAVLGKQGRLFVVSAVAGVVLTVATGTILMLWGAPVAFPGLFEWSEISAMPFGSSYVAAFAVKLVGVVIAAVATFRWAIKANEKAAWATLVGATIAVVALTAMSQYHILIHG